MKMGRKLLFIFDSGNCEEDLNYVIYTHVGLRSEGSALLWGKVLDDVKILAFHPNILVQSSTNETSMKSSVPVFMNEKTQRLLALGVQIALDKKYMQKFIPTPGQLVSNDNQVKFVDPYDFFTEAIAQGFEILKM